METFDRQGGLNDKLGLHKAKDISADFGWDQMGPKIRAELKPGKLRRAIWWWLPFGLSVIMAVGYFSLFGGTTELGYFPMPGQSVGDYPAVAETAMERPMEIEVAKETKGSVPPSDDPKPKGGTNIPVASPNPAAINALALSKSQAAAIPSGPSNEIKDRVAGSADKIWNNLVKSDLLNQIEALSPQAVVSLDTTIPYPAAPEMPSVSHPWIVEAGMGLTFNLNPNVYGTKLPNTTIDPLTGLAVSLRIGYALQRYPYTVWTGIEMAELVQRERLQEALPVQLYQPGTVDTVFRNTITGQAFSTTTDSVPGIRRVNIQQHSTFRSWTIPVLVGKTWSAGGWQLEGKAGMDFNLSSWRSGGYLAEGYELVSVNTQYRTRWAMRLEGQLLLPPARLGQLFVRGGYRRFVNQTEGIVGGSSFRPESLSLIVGWRATW